MASGSNSHSNSIYSLAAYQSNLSSSGRSSGGSSPERTSYLSDTGSNQNTRTQKGTTKEKRNSLGNRRADDPAVLAAALLSLNNPASLNNPNSKDKEKEKEKEKEDTRASKSLATISRRFVEHFGEANTFDYISGLLHVNDVHDGPPVTNRVDGAAEVLGVHVRRIYELIKILEILSLVTVRLFVLFLKIPFAYYSCVNLYPYFYSFSSRAISGESLVGEVQKIF